MAGRQRQPTVDAQLTSITRERDALVALHEALDRELLETRVREEDGDGQVAATVDGLGNLLEIRILPAGTAYLGSDRLGRAVTDAVRAARARAAAEAARRYDTARATPAVRS
jgi:DNA-binding protein YbaB